ncbi:MAG: hypothetical protein H3C35_13640 [Bacteroidetes bacterium]|nr:hypothetical protein [Bacteroidota bacterium]
MSKTKYVVQLCTSCGREAKMEIIGSIVGSETKTWYRCTRCRHSILIDSELQKKNNPLAVTRDSCINYSPEKEFHIGEAIYHSDWDDMGTVKSKERTSNGGNAIWVSFEKNGLKKLIENLPQD